MFYKECIQNSVLGAAMTEELIQKGSNVGPFFNEVYASTRMCYLEAIYTIHIVVYLPSSIQNEHICHRWYGRSDK